MPRRLSAAIVAAALLGAAHAPAVASAAYHIVVAGKTVAQVGSITLALRQPRFTVSAQLNVKNITDTTSYPPSSSRTTIQTGLLHLESLRVEF